MDVETFDEENPWHSYANLMLAFYCVGCEATMDLDLSRTKGSVHEDFLAACVALSEDAQRQGWISIDPYNFACPKCARERC